MRKNRRRFVAIGASLLTMLASAVLTNAPARADSTFVADAIAQAQEAPTSEGKWQVTATVVMTSESSGTMTASGPVAFVKTPNDALWGSLPMKVGGDTSDNHRLNVTVMPDGTVGLQWLIAGKPFLGRPTLIFKASSFPDHLSKLIDFGGVKRRMKLTLSTARVQEATNGGTPPRIRIPKKKEPIGKRYKLTGRLVVTNSEDGFLDNTCEITGVLMYQQRDQGKNGVTMPEQPCLTIIEQDANKGFHLDFRDNIYLDHIFSKPETKFLKIRSSIYDNDSGVDDDCMSYGETRLSSLENIAKSKKEHTLPGDRDSENVEVYYTLTFVEDLY